MFNNLFNSNTYKYNGDIERIDFIGNDSFFAVRNEIYKSACFITNIKNKTNDKILDIEFVHAKYYNGFIYYTITKNHVMYRYNVYSKETKELFTYYGTRIFDINNDIIFLSGVGNNIEEYNLNGVPVTRPLQKEIENFELISFKEYYISKHIFDFKYKDAYIYLGPDKNTQTITEADHLTFTAQEYDAIDDYLVVSTTPYTKYDVNPKIKLFKINNKEDNWDLVSEWNNSGTFVNYLKILNNYIYVIDRKNNFFILDLKCNVLKSIQLKHNVLCFSISPDNKKLAYAFGQYIEIIDISL